jgi:lipopolysaccharide heptosyltransferase II
VKILLIRLRLIGDVVFTTPILRALKRTFPDARLTYLVERDAAAVVAGNPHLDEVLVIPLTSGWRRVRDDVKLARQLRAAQFDVVIDLHGGPRSSWLTWATGAPERIGYDIPGRAWHYTRRVHRPRGLQPQHSVVNQWSLLAAVPGFPSGSPDPARDAVEMALDAAADRRIAERLHAIGVSDRHAIAVIHVSAGNPFRRWPESAFTRFVTMFAAGDAARRIVLSSGPSDRAAAERIAADARAALGSERAHQVLAFGEINLQELRALVARSRVFIGGDTGPLHIAATTRTPIVGLYGPTLTERSAPWRDGAIPAASVHVDGLPCRPCEQRVCVPGDFRCLTTIEPSAVLAAAERVMAQVDVSA